MDDRASELLKTIRQRRGYVLSYHKVFARLDPEFMRVYDELYTMSLLEPRFLDARQRELIWVGIVSLAREEVGEIHLARARAAGVSAEDISAAVSLAGATRAWQPISFALAKWSAFLPDAGEEPYARLVDAARSPLDALSADLILVVLHAVEHQEAAFLHHLRRLLNSNFPETHIAEALSYLLQPVGANTLLWATDAWLRALSVGLLPPSAKLGDETSSTDA